MDNQKESCVIVPRVSTKDQEETGYSLGAQKKLLIEYGIRCNFKIAKIFSISETASKHYQRKIFNEMLKYLKDHNIQHLLVEKVDRLTRNMKDAVIINDWLEADKDRKVHFVKQSLILHRDAKSDEKFRWDIEMVLAKKYTSNLSEEVKKGQMEKIAQGWLPTKPADGYKTIGDKGHKIHVIDDNKAPLVKKIFNLYSTGTISIERLADKMYTLGLRKRSGLKMRTGEVHRLLQKKFYYGVIEWKGKIYPGKHEPLINKELFDKVQQVRIREEAPKYSNLKKDMLYRGIFKCASCGGVITWELHDKRKNVYTYGHCNHYRKCQKRTYIKEPEVSRQITTLFSKLEVKNQRLAEWIKKSLKENHQEEIVYRTNTRNELNNRLNTLDHRLSNLYDDKMDEKISVGFYDKKFEQYSQEKKDLMENLQKLSNETLRYYEVGINIYELSQNAEKLYQEADKEKKRRLLKLVFDELKLDETKVIYKYSRPFEILSQVIAKTNRSKMVKNEKISFMILEHPDFRLDLTKNRAINPVPHIKLRVIDEMRTYFIYVNYNFSVPKVNENSFIC